MAKVVATKPRTAGGAVVAPKAAAGSTTNLGNRTAANRANPSGLRKPAGFEKEWNTYLKAPKAKAAATPSVTPSPVSPYNGTPWSSAEQLSVAGAEDKYKNTLLNLGLKKTSTQQEYGLDQGFNDYKANPFSRAALLEQSYQRANRASGNSLAAGGQLYSGASQNAETYNREHDSQERNALETTYRRALQGIEEEGTGALATEQEEIANAKWKAIEAASNAELEPDSAPAGGSTNPYAEQAGGVSKKVKTKNGKKTTIGISGARKAR